MIFLLLLASITTLAGAAFHYLHIDGVPGSGVAAAVVVFFYAFFLVTQQVGRMLRFPSWYQPQRPGDNQGLKAPIGHATELYKDAINDPLVDHDLHFQPLEIVVDTQGSILPDFDATVGDADDAAGGGGDDNDSSSSSPQPPPPPMVSSSHAAPPKLSFVIRGWHVPPDDCVAESLRQHNKIVFVAVHGAGRDRRAFHRHLPEVHARGYGYVAFDCREHGMSTTKGAGIGYATREPVDVSIVCRYAKAVLGYETVVALVRRALFNLRRLVRVCSFVLACKCHNSHGRSFFIL
jgi:hypothetical protein